MTQQEQDLYKLESRYEYAFTRSFLVPGHMKLLWSFVDTDTKIEFFKHVLGD